MKKIVLTAVFALAAVLGTGIYAQNPVEVGVKGGLNISNFTGDIDNARGKAGFNIGLTLDYELAPSIYLMTGIEYTLKGANADDEGSSANMNIGYIQVPIHLGYKMPIAPETNFVIHAGPYLAYATKATIDYGDVSVNWFGDDYDNSSKPNRFDAGLGAGVGLEFGRIVLGLDVDYGLVNINQYDDGYDGYRNINTNLSIGYKF